MLKNELRNILIDQYISKNGKIKTKKMPQSLIDCVIEYTKFYELFTDQHLSLRCHFIINNISELKKCIECNQYIHPITLQKYNSQIFCSSSCSTKNKDVIQKSKNTNLKKYGVEYATQNKRTIQKQKNTNLKKYGVESVLQKQDILNKKIETTIERYGMTSCFQNNIIQEKIKQTNIEKYGVEYLLLSNEIREKIKQTNIERYGTLHPSQIHLSYETISIINDKNLFCGFITDKTVYEISKELNMDISSIYNIIKKYNAVDLYNSLGPSYLELEMEQFLSSIDIEYKRNNRTILNGKELDFYIPQYNIAIEMNGIYWHNTHNIQDKYYHYNKWKACYDKNIHLVSIFEDDWNNHNIKIKNMLLSFFNKKTKGVPARKSVIQQINGKIARPFLDKYHLQGYVSGKHYGAFDDENNLIGIMTFGYTRNGKLELSRFVMNNYSHSGLFSKLFKHAQQDLNFQEVISFSDNKHFTGKVYNVNGFHLVDVLKPDYKYVVNGKLVHKSNFRKNNIKNKYPQMKEMIEHGVTETQAMTYLKIPRIWDCGKCKWLWKV